MNTLRCRRCGTYHDDSPAGRELCVRMTLRTSTVKRTVRSCDSCPFMEKQMTAFCTAGSRHRGLPHTPNAVVEGRYPRRVPPDWCPLREGPIKIEFTLVE